MFWLVEGGGGERSRQNAPSQLETKERPAKGPHSSALTHNRVQVTHALTLIIFRLCSAFVPFFFFVSSLFLLKSLFHFHYLFSVSPLPNLSLSLLLYFSYFLILTSVSLPNMWMNVQSVWEHGQFVAPCFRKKQKNKIPPSLMLLITPLGNVPVASKSSAV